MSRFVSRYRKATTAPLFDDDAYLALTAGRDVWICGASGREALIRLDPELFAETAYCHRLADPNPIIRRRRKRR